MFAICHVIYMTCHNGLALNSFHIVKHAPCILKVSPELHALHKINTTCRTTSIHFEQAHLMPPLMKKDIFLNLIKSQTPFQIKDVVNVIIPFRSILKVIYGIPNIG